METSGLIVAMQTLVQGQGQIAADVSTTRNEAVAARAEAVAARGAADGLRIDVATLVIQVRAVVDSQSDHESRIRSLERRMYAVPAANTVIAAAAVAVSVLAYVHH